jgi:hypothetical protein
MRFSGGTEGHGNFAKYEVFGRHSVAIWSITRVTLERSRRRECGDLSINCRLANTDDFSQPQRVSQWAPVWDV